jgi:predicted phage tail protein
LFRSSSLGIGAIPMMKEEAMAQKPESRSAAAKAGEAQAEAALATQKELMQTYEQISRAWQERVQAEAELWTELAAKVSNARSIPDAMEAYQQCVAQRMQMAADDGRRLFEDSQKIMATLTRSFPAGWPRGSA